MKSQISWERSIIFSFLAEITFYCSCLYSESGLLVEFNLKVLKYIYMYTYTYIYIHIHIYIYILELKQKAISCVHGSNIVHKTTPVK